MADRIISRLQSQMLNASRSINTKIAEQEELERRIHSTEVAIQMMQNAERCAKELRTTTDAMTFDSLWKGREKRDLEADHSGLKKNTKAYQREISSTIKELKRKKFELELRRNALIRLVGSLRNQMATWQRDVYRRKSELERNASSGNKR